MLKRKDTYKYVYAILLLFWLFTFYQLPLIQDAWSSHGLYNNSENFLNWMTGCLALYFSLNGRLPATIIIGFFERNQLFLDICSALVMVLLVYLICKIFNREKNTFYVLLSCFVSIALPYGVVREVYYYATLMYVLPVVLLLTFSMLLKEYMSGRPETAKKTIGCMFFVSLLNSMWIEHSSIAFILCFFSLIVWDFFSTKKIDKLLVLMEGLNIIVFAIMMCSPGLKINRSLTDSRPFFDLLRDNFVSALECAFWDFKVIHVLIILSGLFIIWHYSRKQIRPIWKILYSVSSFGTLLLLLADSIFGIQEFITGANYIIWAVIVWVSVYLLLQFAPLLTLKNPVILTAFYFIGLVSLVPALVTPNFGNRICYFCCMMLGIILLGACSEVMGSLQNKYITLILLSAVLFVADKSLIATGKIQEVTAIRDSLIEETVMAQRKGEWDFNRTLVIPTYPEGLLFGNASPNNYADPIHYNVFLDYYKLHPKTKLVFSDTYNRLECENTGNDITFHAFPQDNSQEYQYVYYIWQGGDMVWSSDVTEKQMVVFKDIQLEENKLYTYGCMMIDKTGMGTYFYAANN